MGKLPRLAGHHTRSYTIYTADHNYMEATGDGQFVGTHDVYTDTR